MLKNFFRITATLIIGASALGIAQAQTPQTSAPAFEAGKQYFLIEPAQPSSGDKIEVTEVFSYGCPACNFASPTIEKLAKSLPPNAVMNYVPASFNPSEDWPLFQRTFYTAQALGLTDKTHIAMYDAVWKTGELATMDKATNKLKNPQPSLDDVAQFFTRFGVKADEFTGTANSFAINTKMKRADAYVKSTGIESTPTLIVAGKYRLTPQSAGGIEKVEPLVRFLIQKEIAK